MTPQPSYSVPEEWLEYHALVIGRLFSLYLCWLVTMTQCMKVYVSEKLLFTTNRSTPLGVNNFKSK